MVAGAIVGLALIVGVIVFRDDIAGFLREFKPTAPLENAAESVKKAGEKAGADFGRTIILPINIRAKDQEFERRAREEGFIPSKRTTARQQKELATDTGNVVIGSKRNVANVGLIGDKLPTNPSQQFIDNSERLLTPEQLARFQQQQKTFGGKSQIGSSTKRVSGKSVNVNLDKAPQPHVVSFSESIQKTLTGGKLFSEVF